MNNKQPISFKKLPIVDIIKIIDYYQLSQQDIQRIFNFGPGDIENFRSFLKESPAAQSRIQNIELYRDYILGGKTFEEQSTRMLRPGRKTDNISKAFQNIPFSFVSVNHICTTYGVSVAALKQSKRFDVFSDHGRVTFKTIDNTLMVRRISSGE